MMPCDGLKLMNQIYFLRDVYAHAGNDAGIWKGVIGRHGDADDDDNGWCQLQLCYNNALCIMNAFFWNISGLHGEKNTKCSHGWNLGISRVPITGKQTKFFGKPSGVFAAKDLILLNTSKTKMVSYW